MTVEKRGKAVVIAHEQLQTIERVGIGNRERQADIRGGIQAIHFRAHVGIDVIRVADLVGIGGQQRGDFVRRQRAVPDGDFVNLSFEIIPAGVKNAAAADVKIVFRLAEIRRRNRRAARQRPVEIKRQLAVATDGRDVMPGVGGVGISGRHRTGGRPDLDG